MMDVVGCVLILIGAAPVFWWLGGASWEMVTRATKDRREEAASGAGGRDNEGGATSVVEAPSAAPDPPIAVELQERAGGGASVTKIEWTERTWKRTWNPTTGCDRVSPGCDRCYALIDVSFSPVWPEVIVVEGICEGADGFENAVFIAHARTDLPAAIDELDAKDREIERLREALAAVEEELAQADAHNAATLDELALYERLIQIGEVAALDVTALKERLADLERRTGERSGGV